MILELLVTGFHSVEMHLLPSHFCDSSVASSLASSSESAISFSFKSSRIFSFH